MCLSLGIQYTRPHVTGCWNDGPTVHRDRKVVKMVGPRRKTGAMGPRGPRGLRGPRGARGATGPRGKRGQQGPKRLRGPLRNDPSLDTLVRHFDEVYRQLNEHMKRFARMQQQLDVIIATQGKAH